MHVRVTHPYGNNLSEPLAWAVRLLLIGYMTVIKLAETRFAHEAFRFYS